MAKRDYRCIELPVQREEMPNQREEMHDRPEEMHDRPEEMHDRLEEMHDRPEEMHDQLEEMHDQSEEMDNQHEETAHRNKTQHKEANSNSGNLPCNCPLSWLYIEDQIRSRELRRIIFFKRNWGYKTRTNSTFCC